VYKFVSLRYYVSTETKLETENIMKKVIIKDGIVTVDGTEVARIDGRGEVYVTMKNPATGHQSAIARFKYRSPKACAVHWVKFIFSKMEASEIWAKLTTTVQAERTTPVGLAEQFGYVHYNVLKMQKEKAERDARNARFMNVTIVTN
jgi:hypothetical protein